MIQRIQSIWLLLAGICAFATLKLSFYSGSIPSTPEVYDKLNGADNFYIMALTIAVGVLCMVTIFLYQNRPLQLKLSFAAMLAQVLLLVLMVNKTKAFESGTFSLTAVVYAAIPVLLFLTIKGIRADERIVKESNRLR
ncbi:MAG TPA: DUF4293 domain-containing protein [Ferruginibacter sp.]|nr:DUF4293 domain-containing protein [Ferruginibacter sp.]HRO18056.1 DUF4293 domain-containing protein [Ferruginibacter sp.]HRQ21456.1 DUF4293 domain-containing protein [Ferruginibacter sp.]